MKKILYTLCLLLLLMLASTAFAEIKIKQMYGRDFIDYCYVGDLEKVKEGLSLGTNVNYTVEDEEDKGLTPLVAAILSSSENKIEILRLLIEAGANVNSNQFNSGLTPLLIAIPKEDDLEVLKILLNSGADVNYIVNEGKLKGLTPLISSLFNKTLKSPYSTPLTSDIITLLLNAGADVNHIGMYGDFMGLTPLLGTIRRAIEANDPAMIKGLISAGANVNYVAAEGKLKGFTPLLQAMNALQDMAGSPEVTEVLLRSGADVNYVALEGDKRGYSPLMLAAEGTKGKVLDVVRVLLRGGADVNYIAVDGDKKGFSPLLVAAENASSPEVLEVLIKAGANVNYVETSSGATALSLAKENPALRTSYILSKLGD